MSDPSPKQIRLQRLSPILWTKDLKETEDFYVNILGFSIYTRFDDFLSVYRDEVQLMFVIPEPEECEPDLYSEDFFPKPTLTGSIYITTAEVDALWSRIKDQVKIIYPVQDRPYQMRDFSIRDNNGYELVFGQEISFQ